MHGCSLPGTRLGCAPPTLAWCRTSPTKLPPSTLRSTIDSSRCPPVALLAASVSEFSDEVDSMPAQAYEPVLQQVSQARLPAPFMRCTACVGERHCSARCCRLVSTRSGCLVNLPSFHATALLQLWMLRQPNTGGSFVMAGNPPRYLTDTWKGDSGGPLLLPNASDPSRDMQARGVGTGSSKVHGTRLGSPAATGHAQSCTGPDAATARTPPPPFLPAVWHCVQRLVRPAGVLH